MIRKDIDAFEKSEIPRRSLLKSGMVVLCNDYLFFVLLLSGWQFPIKKLIRRIDEDGRVFSGSIATDPFLLDLSRMKKKSGVSKRVRNTILTVLFLTATGQAYADDTGDGIGGPASVSLIVADEEKGNGSRQDRLKFGFDYSTMMQTASNSMGFRSAVGGVARAYGSIDFEGEHIGSGSSLVFKLENRHRAGTKIAPQALGFEAGYVGLTALTYSDAGWLLTNLYWQQSLASNRIGLVLGIVDVTDYVDVYMFGNPWAEFSNLAFSTNPTIPAPDQGLGAAIRFNWGDRGYVLAGIADANGDPGNPRDAFSSFFDKNEYFSHLEVGWFSSWENRFRDNIHLTIWHVDQRKSSGIASGHGAAFSASWKTSELLTPFVRLGYADGGGALMDRSLSVGLGISPRRPTDQFTVGLNWGRPNRDVYGRARTQGTLEAYYRWQPIDWLQISPGIQYVHNPAQNPNASGIWFAGLRIKATF
ncbi:carbohydrate porin [Shimia sp. W99]